MQRLTDRKQRGSSIPAFKRGSDWIFDAEEKANYVVNTFATKNIMIEEEDNENSEIAYDHPTFYFGLPTVEATAKALGSLDEDSA